VTDPDGPASRIEELVPLLRRLWRLHEGPVQHEGRFYSCDITPTADIAPPLRNDIPIWTAGVNPRMIESAGRVADGLICHPTITAGYLDGVARPALEKGAAHAGRNAGDVQVSGVVICAIDDDRGRARSEAAAQIAFYVAPRAYGAVMEASGFGDEAAAVRAAFRAHDHAGMVAAVSDAMLDEMAVAGSPDEVRDALGAFERRYDHAALYSPSFLLTPERVRENTTAIIETFAR
jgi:alkanesulfonate monooxygenase SsuD/methylene tetrahydromethanopterin reductase-like flavin-dependent oxidoreductase (luciferase family)